jgi:hypothetical protein
VRITISIPRLISPFVTICRARFTRFRSVKNTSEVRAERSTRATNAAMNP